VCSDSDLGPVTLPVREQVLHRGHVSPLRLPQLGSPPGPAPARCRSDFRKTFDQSRTAPRPPGHVTLTHDTLAANTRKIKKCNGSNLVYLSFLCTCLDFASFARCHRCYGRMRQARHRKPVAFSLYLTGQVSLFGDVQGRGKGEWKGGGAPANIPYGYIRSVRKRLSSDQSNAMSERGASSGTEDPDETCSPDRHPIQCCPNVALSDSYDHESR
jgi:hypothetical protein